MPRTTREEAQSSVFLGVLARNPPNPIALPPLMSQMIFICISTYGI
jgi:hypothetical protein